MSQDNLIRIENYYDDWVMEFDLKTIAEDAGKRKYDKKDKKYYVDLPIKNAKKIIDLIWRYGRDDDILKMDELFQCNQKLYKYLEDKRKKM